MKTIQLFQTDDGTTFESEVAAKTHERTLEAREEVMAFLTKARALGLAADRFITGSFDWLLAFELNRRRIVTDEELKAMRPKKVPA